MTKPTWTEIPTIPEIEPLPPQGDEAWVALHREARETREQTRFWRVEGSNGHRTFHNLKRAADALVEGEGDLYDASGKWIARVAWTER